MPDFIAGELVLVKNRASGTFETPLIGPFEFVRYKDKDCYAAILEDDTGRQFDCSVTHLVPVEERVDTRRVRQK